MYLNGVENIGQNAFWGVPIKTIYMPATLIKLGASAFSTQYFQNVTLGKDFNCSLNISLGNYAAETMIAMFKMLRDLTNETAKTLNVGTKNLNKLTDEQKAIATNKNWNLA